ncbi:hypothetical protein GCM10025867_11660 [Frondihabitans sucicola]|uniref:GH18 domain-containing protein n=1 Tax=Frondihabitans sucicola TaxID=1268041 RepID=A0ABM8GL62_9MICO|nr:glycosyl hydrolase family 18 protein [Frondihabitans sucicola]BDZ48925.1 hypothetical protein GCM10025867_11660 [Frondihabitans sucicola]
MHRQSTGRALIAGVAVAAVLAAAGCSASSSTDSTAATVPASLSVEGYGVAGASTLAALAREHDAIDMIGISGVSITPEGEGVAASSDDALKIAAAAKKDGTKSELLVNNIDASKGDFSNSIATKMLSSAENRDFVVSGLASEVDHGGYDGIQLDLEYLTADNADDLVSFVTELRSTLPKTATISLAVMAETSPAAYQAAGYDLAALSPLVDRFVVMAYDEHGTGFSAAGPVGGLLWAKQVVSALTSVVKPAKVDLGVAGYGYSWKKDGKGGVVTPAQARKQAGSRASWVSAQGEWTAKLQDGTVLWWSDGKSLTVRSNYAESVGLHGVALWQLTTGDRIVRAG